MKRICYCTTVFSTINAFILKSAKYIHEHTDWDISFICNEDEDFAKSLPDYIHYYPIKMNRGISFDGLRAIREMMKIFKREKFDLVQYSTPNASLYASIAAKSAKIPVRLYCQWGMVFTAFSGWKKKLFKAEEKFVCNNSTWVEPDSRSNLSLARSEGLYSEKKSSVIWNGSACGVDFDKFDITKKGVYRKTLRKMHYIPDNAFVYIFVGRVNRDKGINELLDAYRSVSIKHPSYLLIVGNNEADEHINKELYEWSLSEKNVIYTGSTSVVEQYLAASDCFVLPSYREGFGMSVIEAQAMALPVVVTDIPGPIDAMIPNQTGLVVSKQDAVALQSAMEKMHQDSDMCRQFGEAGYLNVVNNFEQKKLFEYILADRKRLLC